MRDNTMAVYWMNCIADSKSLGYILNTPGFGISIITTKFPGVSFIKKGGNKTRWRNFVELVHEKKQ